mmetsp:Transcript_46853/g.124464  ORF Transcript_46853/g.124464 Transcript_46853/m.124464 type:complete len:216 (+) Transcript_46853:195-842(+)
MPWATVVENLCIPQHARPSTKRHAAASGIHRNRKMDHKVLRTTAQAHKVLRTTVRIPLHIARAEGSRIQPRNRSRRSQSAQHSQAARTHHHNFRSHHHCSFRGASGEFHTASILPPGDLSTCCHLQSHHSLGYQSHRQYHPGQYRHHRRENHQSQRRNPLQCSCQHNHRNHHHYCTPRLRSRHRNHPGHRHSHRHKRHRHPGYQEHRTMDPCTFR